MVRIINRDRQRITKTVAASSNDTACFAWFLCAFSGSHSNCTIAGYHDDGLASIAARRRPRKPPDTTTIPPRAVLPRERSLDSGRRSCAAYLLRRAGRRAKGLNFLSGRHRKLLLLLLGVVDKVQLLALSRTKRSIRDKDRVRACVSALQVHGIFRVIVAR